MEVTTRYCPGANIRSGKLIETPSVSRNPLTGTVPAPMLVISTYSKSSLFVKPAALSAGVGSAGLYMISVMRIDGALSTVNESSASGLQV